MVKNYNNNEIFKKITSTLSTEEVEHFTRILEALRPTPDLTGLNYTVTRLSECFQIAKKVRWPGDFNNQLEEQIELIDKIIANENFVKVKIFPSTNPIYSRILDFPVAALFCQSLLPRLKVELKESLLFIQHLIFLVLFNCKPSYELIKSTCNELRKQMVEENLFTISIPFERLDHKILVNIFDLLIEKGKIEFQRQLSTVWRDLINSKLDIKVEKEYKPLTPRITQSETSKPISTPSSKRSPVRKSHNKIKHQGGYTTQKSIQYTPTNLESVEVDNSITETIELFVKEGITLDRRTKQGYILSQNRLSIIEQKLLPWRTNSLADHEITELTAFIKEQLNDTELRGIAIYSCLSMITSKPYTKLNDFLVTNKAIKPLDADNIIELSSGIWWRRSIKMPACFMASDAQKCNLYEHGEYIALPLPVELVQAFKTYSIQHAQWLDELCLINEPRTQLTEFFKLFKQSNDAIFRTITPAAVRAVAFNQVAYKFNEGYAALLLANSEYTSPTILYYLSAFSEPLQLSYQKLLHGLGFSPSQITEIEHYKTGSELAVHVDELSLFLSKKIDGIEQYNQVSTDIYSLIKYHNDFASYVSLMLLAATGHRLCSEYGFCDFTINERLGYVLLADKINYADSAIRIVPLPKMLIEQLASYRNHCGRLARQLKKGSVASQALSKVSNENTYNSPLLFHIQNNAVVPIGNTQIEYYLSPDINLPSNFMRHLFCSSLIENEHYDFMSSLMGHVGNGAHILSDFSCLKLSDINTAADAIDRALHFLGFKHLSVLPPKGRGLIPSGKYGDFYRADYLYRSENKEVAEHIKWVKKIIKPHINLLIDKNTQDQAILRIDKSIRTLEANNISLERRLYWMNRWLYKLTKSNRWVSTNSPEHELYLETDLLVVMDESERITNMINQWLISNEDTGSSLSWIAKLWVSLNINSHYVEPLNQKVLTTIISAPFQHKQTGIAWYQLGTQAKPNCVYLDSITQLLCFNRPELLNDLISVSAINQYLKSTILLKIKRELILSNSTKATLASMFKLMTFINAARHQNHLSLLDAHKNKRINSTSIQPENTIRWLSKGQYSVNNLDIEALPSITPYSKQKIKSNQCDLFANSLTLMDQLHKALKTMIEGRVNSKAKVEALILSIWGEFTGCKDETDISVLIQSSENIDNVMVLILVWLIDVSKRPGKENRENTAPSTVKTYLSNVGKPILEQTIGLDFLQLNSEELTELYVNAHESRMVKDKPQRAAAFRRFHQFNKDLFGLESINWYEVEPNIDKQIQNVNANLISMTEYEATHSILKHDKDSSHREKRINQLLLTLCYRAGLRSGEAMHLKVGDVDIYNWILHIRTHQAHRLKTIKSNRRVHVLHLFSDQEKELMLEQINEAKQNISADEDNWLFCDLNNPHYLVERYKHVQRVTEAIKIATGDMSMRLHNARHSFANYLLMILVAMTYSFLIKQELKYWARIDDFEALSKLLRNSFMSSENHCFNALFAVSVAMGHSTPKTTLSSYIHCLDLMLLAQGEVLLFEQVKIPDLAKRVNIERTNVNHILKRGDCSLYGLKPLISRVKFNKADFINVSLRDKTISGLSDRALNTETYRYHSLNNIERIIRAAEDNHSITDIVEMYQLSYGMVQRVIEATIRLKKETAYAGTSINSNSDFLIFNDSSQKVNMTAKYIRQSEFQTLLKKASKLPDQQLNNLTSTFVDSYNSRYGMVLSTNDTDGLTLLAKLLGYQAEIEDELISIKCQYGLRKGHVSRFIAMANSAKKYSREHNNDNRFTHCLFLIAVLISTLNIGNEL